MNSKIDATYLLEHPVPISIATGLANGVIFKLRNKRLELKTVATLAAVQGAGEAILVMYEDPKDRGPILRDMELWQIGLYSAIGTIVGMLPFMSFGSSPAPQRAATSGPVGGFQLATANRRYRPARAR